MKLIYKFYRTPPIGYTYPIGEEYHILNDLNPSIIKWYYNNYKYINLYDQLLCTLFWNLRER